VADNLVIVESPAKARTIERYLGPGFKVMASYGHVRDLPRSDFAIELEEGGGCHLVYEIPERAAKHVAALRKEAKGASTVWLAPDLDREGEAIAWHLAEVLDLDIATTRRVTFDEITEPAIKAAFADPRTLDTDLVEAQQARRAVDRIVGYRLSPVLWRTVASGISAGRVQSVALRLLVDREDEIRAFVPETYFDFVGMFGRSGERADGVDVRAKLVRVDGRRIATPKDLEGKDERQLADLLVVRGQEEADALAVRAESLVTRSPRSVAPSSSATRSLRSRPRPCRARRRASGSPPARRWRSRSSSTRASSWTASRSGSSPTCGPTRSTSPTSR
jgi:DNA topoisomerase I